MSLEIADRPAARPAENAGRSYSEFLSRKQSATSIAQDGFTPHYLPDGYGLFDFQQVISWSGRF